MDPESPVSPESSAAASAAGESLRDQEGRRLAVLEERQRLARELHDSVTQMIFSAALLAESVAPAFERDAEEGRRRLERLSELLRRALGEMRAVVRELAPPRDAADFSSRELPPPAVARLHREGLVAVLVQEALALERRGVRARVHGDGYERQSRGREEALLRVAQEALANVDKHAGAHEVELTLTASETEVVLRIRDDGCGFDARERAAERGESGFGLASMRDRVRELEGSFRVVSAPGEGTVVEVALPR